LLSRICAGSIGRNGRKSAAPTMLNIDRELSCHAYVNQPYSRVRDVLLADPHRVFQQATAAAAAHAATLHVHLGGLDVGADVDQPIAMPWYRSWDTGDAEGITVALAVKDQALTPELQRRVAHDL
jgi:hypothetical protein